MDLFPTFSLLKEVLDRVALCPLVLYVLSAEPFNEVISNCNDISGIQLFDNQAKIFQHADDTTFVFTDMSSMDYIFQIIGMYEKASGSKCNRHKTELVSKY